MGKDGDIWKDLGERNNNKIYLNVKIVLKTKRKNKLEVDAVQQVGLPRAQEDVRPRQETSCKFPG